MVMYCFKLYAKSNYICMKRITIYTYDEEEKRTLCDTYVCVYTQIQKRSILSVGANVSREEAGNLTALTGINCAGMENNLLECTGSGTLTSSDTCQYLARVSCTGEFTACKTYMCLVLTA